MNEVEHRRADDPRIAQLMLDVAEMKEDVKAVHDLLASFRVLAAVCKWLTVVGAGIAAMWHGISYIHGK